MYFLILLLLAIGQATDASGPTVQVTHEGAYRSIADGWRRTNRGWENTAFWNRNLLADTNTVTPHVDSFPALTACVDFVAGLHPALIAGVQLLSATYLMRRPSGQSSAAGERRPSVATV